MCGSREKNSDICLSCPTNLIHVSDTKPMTVRVKKKITHLGHLFDMYRKKYHRVSDTELRSVCAS